MIGNIRKKGNTISDALPGAFIDILGWLLMIFYLKCYHICKVHFS